MEPAITLLGSCGDVGPIHEPVDAFCSLAQPVLAQTDLRFGPYRAEGDAVIVA